MSQLIRPSQPASEQPGAGTAAGTMPIQKSPRKAWAGEERWSSILLRTEWRESTIEFRVST